MTEVLKFLEKENRNVSEETFRKALYMEEEYVKSLIHQTMPNLNIYLVEKVNNNFLEAFFLITKDEYQVRCGHLNVEVKQLLHVTSKESVKSITKDNLDWRRTIRGTCGKGVYFSSDAHLANSICNPVGIERAIVVCKVLVGRTSTNFSQTLNPLNANFDLGLATGSGDTGLAYNGKVFVKFGDNEYLPIFVAYYDYVSTKCDTISMSLLTKPKTTFVAFLFWLIVSVCLYEIFLSN